jgi:hypothetical protein
MRAAIVLACNDMTAPGQLQFQSIRAFFADLFNQHRFNGPHCGRLARNKMGPEYPGPMLTFVPTNPGGSIAQIDHGSPVLRLAHTRTGADQRIGEVPADGHDIAGVQAFAYHFVLDRLRPSF